MSTTPPFSIWDEINREWLWLTTTTRTKHTIKDWAHRWPVFASALTGDDIVSTAWRNPQRVFTALLTEYRAGSELAGRITVQCMMAKLIKIAPYARTETHESATFLYCERAQLTLHAFTEAMQSCSLHVDNIAATLALNTLHSITHSAPRLVTLSLIEEIDDGNESLDLVDTNDSDDEVNGKVLLSWARDSNVLANDELSALFECYLNPANSGLSDAAVSLGCTYSTARKRASRAVQKLRIAVTDSIKCGTFFPESSISQLMSA